jgi:hypothetical protein
MGSGCRYRRRTHPSPHVNPASSPRETLRFDHRVREKCAPPFPPLEEHTAVTAPRLTSKPRGPRRIATSASGRLSNPVADFATEATNGFSTAEAGPGLTLSETAISLSKLAGTTGACAASQGWVLTSPATLLPYQALGQAKADRFDDESGEKEDRPWQPSSGLCRS